MLCVERLVLAIAATVAGLASTGATACDLVLTPVTPTLRLDYDPFAFLPTTGRLAVDVENREPRVCDIDLLLLNARNIAVDDVDIDDTGVGVSIASSDPALTPTATAGVWRARLQPSARSRILLDVRVTRDAIASAGEHSADLSMEWRDAGALSSPAAPLPVHIVLIAPPRAQMNIAGAAGVFGRESSLTRIDFGVLAGMVTRRAFLQLRSNTPARLSIDSANRGNLVRAGVRPGEPAIAYAMSLDGEPIDLDGHWQRDLASKPTLDGESLALSFTVEADRTRVEGIYSDTLTIVFSAL